MKKRKPTINMLIKQAEKLTENDEPATRLLFFDVLERFFPFPGVEGQPLQDWQRIHQFIDGWAFECAAIAIIEREYPEQTNPWSVRQVLGAKLYVALIDGCEDILGAEAEAKTPGLALLQAFLFTKL